MRVNLEKALTELNPTAVSMTKELASTNREGVAGKGMGDSMPIWWEVASDGRILTRKFLGSIIDYVRTGKYRVDEVLRPLKVGGFQDYMDQPDFYCSAGGWEIQVDPFHVIIGLFEKDTGKVVSYKYYIEDDRGEFQSKGEPETEKKVLAMFEKHYTRPNYLEE